VEVSQDFIGAVMGAAIGSLVAGYWNLRVQRDQQAHSLKMQKEQWEREDQLREAARKEEADKEQREIWRELLLITPRFVHAATQIYQRKLELWRKYKETGSDEFLQDASQEIAETLTQYRDLRERLEALGGELTNEKAREALQIIWVIGIDMVNTHPRNWIDSTSFYGGHEPMFLIQPRLEQFKTMLRRLLRGEPIDHMVVMTAEQEDAAIKSSE
jgi:hypothetical protein